jgi:RNA polymerase sigma factor (sigma-70 family)
MTDWSLVMRQFGPMVWRAVYRLVNNEADAEDCFQETWRSVVKLAGKQEVRNWPAFLTHVATLRAIECLRRRVRESSHTERMAIDPIPDPRAVDPGKAAEERELAAALRNALAEFDAPRQAEVFCLSELEGLSHKEIADQLGINSNHVGVLLRRAKVRLRVLMCSHNPASDVGRSSGENQI